MGTYNVGRLQPPLQEPGQEIEMSKPRWNVLLKKEKYPDIATYPDILMVWSYNLTRRYSQIGKDFI
jgi:hypothetical protein